MAKTTAAGGGMGRMTGLWMLLGVAATALFFWWITATSEPSQMMVVADESEEEAPVGGGMAATAVPLADLTGTPAQYAGQTVRVPSATVTSIMGDNAFWVEGPGGNPFLVVKDEAFAALGGVTLQQGAQVSIAGQFWEQTPETIQQWRDSGFMTDAGHLAQAEFATHYIQAREIAPAQAAAPTTGQ